MCVVAAHLFHFGVELILKSALLKPAYEDAYRNLSAARAQLAAERGPDARLPRGISADCLKPYIARADELEDEFGHTLPRLWEAFQSPGGR